MSTAAKPVSIPVNDTTHVSGLLQNPPGARACYVLAHGAGAGMVTEAIVRGSTAERVRDANTDVVSADARVGGMVGGDGLEPPTSCV